MLNSDYRQLGYVAFPAFLGRQRYMHAFNIDAPVMAEGYEDYLPAVTALCRASGVPSGTAYMTVDEKIVHAGQSQRRPAPHVDGCFLPDASRWGHPGPSWGHGAYLRRMSVIVAASVSGCKAWRGQFAAQPDNNGDLSHIAAHLGSGELLPASVGYLLSPDCVHESMAVRRDVRRSFLRIALPVSNAAAERPF